MCAACRSATVYCPVPRTIPPAAEECTASIAGFQDAGATSVTQPEQYLGHMLWSGS
jgi:hypothetical protein